jgi:hypothetical protein
MNYNTDRTLWINARGMLLLQAGCVSWLDERLKMRAAVARFSSNTDAVALFAGLGWNVTEAKGEQVCMVKPVKR